MTSKKINRGSAAQKLAVESTQNIANVHIGGDVVGHVVNAGKSTGILTEDFALITKILSNEGPVTVGVLAKLLPWDSTKTAQVLERAGQSGLLEFFKEGDTTKVAIPRTGAMR